MGRYVRIVRAFVRLGILNELEYRINFFVQVFQTILSLIVAIGGISIIYDHTQTLNGWVAAELLAVVGVYFLIGGFIYTLIQPSLTRFMEDIRMGTLDFTLLKPADAQLLVSIKQFQLWKVFDILLGLVLLVIAVWQMQGTVGLAQAAAFALAVVAGGTIAYCVWLILATFTFWFIRVDNIFVIFDSLYEAGRYPVSIYPWWLRFTLTFLIPVAFAVTVPAEALVGRLTAETLLLAWALALALLILSRRFWFVGIRNYTGASA